MHRHNLEGHPGETKIKKVELEEFISPNKLTPLSFFRLVNDHILLQGTMSSSIPDMRKVNGLIDVSSKDQEDGANIVNAEVGYDFNLLPK